MLEPGTKTRSTRDEYDFFFRIDIDLFLSLYPNPCIGVLRRRLTILFLISVYLIKDYYDYHYL